MNTPELVLGVNAFVALLAGALLVSMVAERVRIPAAVLLVMTGMVAGGVWHVRPPFSFSGALLFIFLPPLIFEAAWNVRLDDLRRTWKAIACLAFPGTLFVAFAVAGGIVGLGLLPFGAAFLVGAIVAATDPVAVIAVFRNVPVPNAVRTIVEAESVANDGVAVVLYSAALALALGESANWLVITGHGILAIVGGIVVGGIVAWAGAWLLRATTRGEVEVMMSVVLAYVAYLAADRLTLSGIFACASAGLVLRALHHRDDRLFENVDEVDRFWHVIAAITNAVVFVAMGLLIDVPGLGREPLLIGIAIAIVFASRAVIVAAVIRDSRSRTTVFLAGIRGALPVALALALPEGLPHRGEIVDVVFATVFVTLVLQGLPLELVARRLYPAQRVG